MKRPYAVFFVLVMLFATFALSLAACNDNTGGTTQDDTSAVQDPDDAETPSTDDPSSDDDIDTDDEATYFCYRPVQGYDYTEGDEIEHITYYSSVAGADKHANVILPVDYDPEKSYPVLYLLHGLMSDEYSWIDGVYGLEMGANYIVQNAHYFDGAPEMIVVCVNSLVNATETEPEWDMFPPSAPPELAETYDLTGRDITECLMPYINAHYSTLTGKENTAIAGYSMGGREAMLTAFAYQDIFGWVGAFSSASFGTDVVSASDYVPDFTLDKGSDGFYYVQVTVGGLDTLAPVSRNICARLDEIGVEYTYNTVFLGMHSPSVWRSALNDFVKNIFTDPA